MHSGININFFLAAHDNLDNTLVEHTGDERLASSPPASPRPQDYDLASESISDQQFPPVCHDTNPVEDMNVEQSPLAETTVTSPGKYMM